MSKFSGLRLYLLQLKRKWDKVWTMGSEWVSYMPHADQYRYPNPASLPKGVTPRQEFMKEFHIKYYKRDFRSHIPETEEDYYIINRCDVIKDPIRLFPGETVGPFYPPALQGQKIITVTEAEVSQVYTHIKPRYEFKPKDAKVEEYDPEELKSRYVSMEDYVRLQRDPPKQNEQKQ